MNRNRLGKSGIVVSDICMGTMTFGNQAGELLAADVTREIDKVSREIRYPMG